MIFSSPFRKKRLYHIRGRRFHVKPYMQGDQMWGRYDIHEIPPEWELVAEFDHKLKSMEDVNNIHGTGRLYVFEKYAENPVEGVPFSNDTAKEFMLFGGDLEYFEIKPIPKTLLPCFMGLSKLYGPMEAYLRGTAT